jgi:hypothetical protein
MRRSGTWFVRVLAFLALTLNACSKITGRSVAVEFSDAHGITGGEKVYLAGVIGSTGSPGLKGGKAQVPLTLDRKHKDALLPDTISLLKRDPKRPDRNCLVAFTAATNNKPGVRQETTAEPPATWS